MKTWLFTWNIERWPWNDSLYGFEELIMDIEQSGHGFCKWTCGNNKSIKKGDRIFLIKLGGVPKGIVASGYAASNVFEGTHWDETKKNENKKARRVVVDFDKIIDFRKDSILDFEILKGISNQFHWSTQSSGIGIDADISKEIELHWKKLDDSNEEIYTV